VMVSSGGAIVENAALTANLPVYATASGLTTTAPNDGVQGYWTRDNTNSRLYNTTLGDNVGIGVATPDHALQVSRDVTIPQLSLYNPGNATDKIAGMRMGTGSGWNIQLRTQQDKDWLQLANADGSAVFHSWNGARYYPGSSSNNNANTGYISGDGTNVGIGLETPASKLQVLGKTTLSRSGDVECCGNDATIALADNPATTGRASISFHNSGESEGLIQLTQNVINGVSSRRIQLLDNQSQGLGLEIGGSGGVNGRLWYGASGSRTEVRNDAGLQGDAGAQSGFFETSAPVGNWYSGASDWQHLIDVRHSNAGNNYAMQFAGSFFDQRLFFRKTDGNPAKAWSSVQQTALFAEKLGESANIGSGVHAVLTSGNLEVKNGERYTVTVIADLVNAGGDGPDRWRLTLNANDVSGCATVQLDNRQITSEPNADHNSYHTYSHVWHYWPGCNGTVNFTVFAERFNSDDNWRHGNFRMIVTRL
jgi:hypothetical protein